MQIQGRHRRMLNNFRFIVAKKTSNALSLLESNEGIVPSSLHYTTAPLSPYLSFLVQTRKPGEKQNQKFDFHVPTYFFIIRSSR